MRHLLGRTTIALGLILTPQVEAGARALTTQVTELDKIPRVRPEYPVPDDPNMLFYIERSVDANTVVYAANLKPTGQIDPDSPVEAYWRMFNADGRRKPLIMIERMLAYGVKSVTRSKTGDAVSFKVAALPEWEIRMAPDDHGHPEALMQFGDHTAKLVYVYLQVDDSGLMPKVTSLDLFGIDKLSGKPLQDHVIPH
jgi:hypothetical protein